MFAKQRAQTSCGHRLHELLSNPTRHRLHHSQCRNARIQARPQTSSMLTLQRTNRSTIQPQESNNHLTKFSMSSARLFHTRPSLGAAPSTRDRGPKSEETTQTDFGALDVLGGIPPPASSIETCLPDGFVLSNGVTVVGAGVLLLGGEVFEWKPWLLTGGSESKPGGNSGLVRLSGVWHVGEPAWGLLDLMWPKPGTGKSIRPLSPDTRRIINSMGIRVEVLDTRNAAAQYNLLATERGVHEVAAALVPIETT